MVGSPNYPNARWHANVFNSQDLVAHLYSMTSLRLLATNSATPRGTSGLCIPVPASTDCEISPTTLISSSLQMTS